MSPNLMVCTFCLEILCGENFAIIKHIDSPKCYSLRHFL
jgi:hypothetical protein